MTARTREVTCTKEVTSTRKQVRCKTRVSGRDRTGEGMTPLNEAATALLRACRSQS